LVVPFIIRHLRFLRGNNGLRGASRRGNVDHRLAEVAVACFIDKVAFFKHKQLCFVLRLII